jgi:hypothetical protein
LPPKIPSFNYFYFYLEYSQNGFNMKTLFGVGGGLRAIQN